MAKLTPNTVYTMNGVAISEKIIPDGTRWKDSAKAVKAGFSAGALYKKQQKLSGGTGKVQSVTIHNTNDLDNVCDDGEQYTRATYNENMNSSRVHFYVDDTGAWQNLRAGTGLCPSDPDGSAEVGWHSGDGSTATGGNMTSLSIEVIMDESPDHDKIAKDNGARIAAWLLWKHGLSINALVTHTYWVNKSAGKTFADRDVQCCNPIYGKKWCPTYIFASTNPAVALNNWKAFKELVKGYLDALNGGATSGVGAGDAGAESYTAITGTAQATAEQMAAYLKAKNPGAPQSVFDMIPFYLSEGAAEGVRGDIAFAQSCLETGNFGFNGSAVTLDQNNFCGMGVTANGMKGNSFDTPQMGIRAQVQHLKAYANSEPLKNACIDPRFRYVTRSSAPYVEWLGQKENPAGKGWAVGAGYGGKILAILSGILAVKVEPASKPESGAAGRYNKISDMPGYAQATIKKMVDGGFIGGSGTGAQDEDGRPADLDLSSDMIRVFVTNDRAGLYDR